MAHIDVLIDCVKKKYRFERLPLNWKQYDYPIWTIQLHKAVIYGRDLTFENLYIQDHQINTNKPAASCTKNI